MLKKLKPFIESAIASLLLLSIIFSYSYEPLYKMAEMTCITNSSVGLMFLVNAIMSFRKKKSKNYQEDFSLLLKIGMTTLFFIMIVFLVSFSELYYMRKTLDAFFIHLINPLAVAIYYFIYVREPKDKKLVRIFIPPIFVCTYLTCDYIIGCQVGRFMYELFTPFQVPPLTAIALIIIAYIIVFIFNILLSFLNRKITNIITGKNTVSSPIPENPPEQVAI